MRRYGLICQGLMLAAGAMLATTTARTTAFAAEGPFHIEHTWQIGGEGGWDYIAVDPQGGLLYVTRGNHVQVVDRKSGKQVADITGLHGTHGVVFAPGGKRIHQRRRRQPGGGIQSQDIQSGAHGSRRDQSRWDFV